MPSAAKEYKPSTEKSPTSSQWWKIATEAIRLLGVETPESRADASQLISQLVAAGSSVASEEVPF